MPSRRKKPTARRRTTPRRRTTTRRKRRSPSLRRRIRSRRKGGLKRAWVRLKRRLTWSRAAQRRAYWSSVAALWGATAVFGVYIYFSIGLPDTSELWTVDARPAVIVLDRDGRRLVSRGTSYGAPITVAELPPYLPRAVVATEDRRFYHHIGIDPLGLVRAMIANLNAGTIVQGGSTITQQLAKILFLSPERTYRRKIQEMILAFRLERRFSKDQILSLYLNRVYLGAGTYGVEAAAQRYFGKSASDVTLPEAAMLAGLLKAPSLYAPTAHPERARARAEVVLASMVEAGFITPQERFAAHAAPPRLAQDEATPGANYFIDWITAQIEDLVGAPTADIVVRTTLDMNLQAKAEAAVARGLERDGAKLKFDQAALVALTPDGAVRAMVGGRSYTDSQFNRAVQARRQPGSAFKPFVYLAALEAGFLPYDRVLDAPVSVGNWRPDNYNSDYEGEVTLTVALARSLNSAAIRVAEQVGTDAVVDVARRAGIGTPLSANKSLALGTSEVTLVELTSAYAPFANGGFKAPPFGITRIATVDGHVLYERTDTNGIAFQPTHMGAMNAMLSETLRQGTGRQAALAGRPAAGKTGTSQDSRDAWFVGYTADLVTGIWVGNDDFTPTRRVTGGSAPAIMWNDFMEAAGAGSPVHPLPGTDGSAVVASRSGDAIGDSQDDGNAFERLLSKLFPGL